MTQPSWVRPMAFGVLILFLASWMFPLGAALTKDTSVFSKWWGIADVTLAFFLAIAAFAVQASVWGTVDKRAEGATYRIYRLATHGLIAVAALVIVAGDKITWANCATGFLWRTWLGLYLLPWWIVAVRTHGEPGA